MVFSSPVFLFLFLPVLLGLYFMGPRGLRNPLLLAVSLLFYLWGEKLYIVVLLASIAMNYLMGLALDALQDRRRWAGLAIALTVLLNLGLLLTFKYANFLVDNLNVLLARIGAAPLEIEPVHLPLGISFFTFHALSYVIDIYRREVRALKNPVNFALYISFFPQSIAGPIVRYSDLKDQLPERTIDLEGFAQGVRRFVYGLAKKMLIANTLAWPADAIFGLPTYLLTPGLAWLGIVCYTLQIYFDFSGYSDMALGLARMFGFRFPENFNYPYIARSVTEFWRRWHISLSTWYRDYLYIPLGGNRRGLARTYINLVTVFFLCGLWHGASWAFIAWGLFHGGFLAVERMGLGKLLERLAPPLRHLYLLVVVMVGWVFFRATTFTQAGQYLKALIGMAHGRGVEYNVALYLNREVLLMLVAGVIGSMPFVPAVQRAGARLLELARPGSVRAAVAEVAVHFTGVAAVALLLLASAMLLAGGTYNPFIYFRF